MIKKNWLVFPSILALTFVFFYQSLNYYFFQDDWFVLNWVRTGDFLSFWQFRTDIIYWRPISMPIFFWISGNLFGLNPFGFHLISFFLHLVNILLLALISYLLFKNKKAALLTSFLYATASFHFMSLSWLSLTWNTIGYMFLQMALIFYLINLNNRSILSYFGIYLFFLLALASNEFAIVFPFLIIASEVVMNVNARAKIFQNLKIYFPLIFIIIAYLFIRTIISPIPAEREYKIAIDFKIFKNFFWYGLWLFNMPEELKNQIVLSKLQVTRNFLNAAQNYLPIIIVSFVTNIVSLAYITLKSMNKKNLKLFFVSWAIFIIGLVPVLFLSQHSFPYYLTIPSILIFIIVGLTVTDYLHKYKSVLAVLLVLVFILSWLTTSYATLSLTKKIHWVTAEQNLSREYVNYVREMYPKTPSNLQIDIFKSSKQVIQSLMDQNAMKVIYNNNDIKTIYIPPQNTMDY